MLIDYLQNICCGWCDDCDDLGRLLVIVGQIGPKVGLCPDFWEGAAEGEEEPIKINHNTNCSPDQLDTLQWS